MKALLILLLTFTLISCNQQQTQQLPKSDVIAVVGDEQITADLLKAFLLANGISDTDGAVLNKALDRLIEDVAIAQIAKKKQLPLTTEQLNTMEYLRIKAFSNNAKKDYLLNNIVTEEEIQTEYAMVNELTGGFQYHVRHIMFKDEVEAIKMLDSIKSVDEYKQQETVYLQKNPKLSGVGDLGWVTMGQLPKSFREVLINTAENTLIRQVINSNFGAHVVYLQGIKAIETPKIDDVRLGIIKTIKNKKLSKLSQLAQAKAHVDIKE